MDFASTAVVVLSLVSVLAVVVARHRARRLRGKNKIYHPVAGTVVHQLINFSRLHHYMTELACKYKTYRMLDLFKGAVYTADPANVEYVLKTNFTNYGKGSYMYSVLSDGLGNGIFGVDGQKWRHQRKVMSAEFSTKVVRDFSSAVFKTNAVKLAGIIYEASICNQAIEIQLKKRDLVSWRLEMKDTDPKYLRDMVLCVTVAGQDTTASSLSWFVYMMCKHLHIQEKIAKEVREVTNLKDNLRVDELAAILTDEALNKMQYLHAALTETLRLYPAVPMNMRMCFSDDTWPDGFSVKKGDMVVYQPYAMGRMKSLWGDDAEEFQPERWLDENGLFHDESPYKFIAFSAGPRICLGKEHAYTQMKIFSAMLLGSYIFKLADEKNIVNYKTMITLPIDGGLYVTASPRIWHARP